MCVPMMSMSRSTALWSNGTTRVVRELKKGSRKVRIETRCSWGGDVPCCWCRAGTILTSSLTSRSGQMHNRKKLDRAGRCGPQSAEGPWIEREVPHHARGRSRNPHCRRFTRWRGQGHGFFLSSDERQTMKDSSPMLEVAIDRARRSFLDRAVLWMSVT